MIIYIKIHKKANIQIIIFLIEDGDIKLKQINNHTIKPSFNKLIDLLMSLIFSLLCSILVSQGVSVNTNGNGIATSTISIRIVSAITNGYILIVV